MNRQRHSRSRRAGLAGLALLMGGGVECTPRRAAPGSVEVEIGRTAYLRTTRSTSGSERMHRSDSETLAAVTFDRVPVNGRGELRGIPRGLDVAYATLGNDHVAASCSSPN